MRKIKIKATRDYYDTQLDRRIKNGEETTVSLERAEKITGLNYATIIETVEEEQNDSDLTLKELREKYPDIKATSKKRFLEQI